MDRVTRFLIVGGIVGALLLWFTAIEYGALAVQTLCAALVYAATCELYLFLFTMTISSISSNMLVRLSGGQLSRSEMDASYDSRAMVEQRLERLVSTGFLASQAGRLSPTEKGIKFVASMSALRRLFKHA